MQYYDALDFVVPIMTAFHQSWKSYHCNGQCVTFVGRSGKTYATKSLAELADFLKKEAPIDTKATSAIKAEINSYSKTIDQCAKSRWKQGYVDGLSEALKIIEGEYK